MPMLSPHKEACLEGRSHKQPSDSARREGRRWEMQSGRYLSLQENISPSQRPSLHPCILASSQLLWRWLSAGSLVKNYFSRWKIFFTSQLTSMLAAGGLSGEKYFCRWKIFFTASSQVFLLPASSLVKNIFHGEKYFSRLAHKRVGCQWALWWKI